MAFANQYVLGRGKVYFTRFAAGTKTPIDGARYIGNCPAFSVNASEDKLDHFSSEGGLKVLDASVTLQLTRAGAFTTDNIDKDNLALLFSGTASTISQTAQTAQVQRVTGAKGRYYQLGQTASNPAGVRNVSNITVKDTAATPVTVAATEYTVDAVLGRVYFKDDSTTIVNGTQYDITYDTAACSVPLVLSKNDTVYGAIKFISDNGYGENREYYLPYVKLAPNGDFGLISDDWQSMEFSMDVLKLDSITESMYITSRPTTP